MIKVILRILIAVAIGSVMLGPAFMIRISDVFAQSGIDPDKPKPKSKPAKSKSKPGSTNSGSSSAPLPVGITAYMLQTYEFTTP